MRAPFAVWGHSLAVRIPSSVAREAKIAEGMAAELSIVDGKLVVTPVDAVPVYQLSDLVAAITDENRHGEIGTPSSQGDEFA